MNRTSPECNICGVSDFGPGPSGRMSYSGKPPHCRNCDSLERSRIVHALMSGFPLGFLDWRHALRFGENSGLRDAWFRQSETSPFVNGKTSVIQSAVLASGGFDLIYFNHMLEFLPDAKAAFVDLLRLLSPQGIMVGCFASPLQRDATEEFTAPMGQHGAKRLFGKDLDQYFDCGSKKITVFAVGETDPCTGTREFIHFFTRQPAEAERMRKWLSGWSETAFIYVREY